MLKLPPPFWALAYTLIAIGASDLMGWPRVTGLPLVWLGVVLVVLGIGLSVTAAMLFRRDGTEINPTSPTNRKLVTSWCREPSWLENIELGAKKAIKRENIDPKYSHV